MTNLSRIVLAATLALVAPAVAQAPKKATASPDLQKEFDGFIAKFRAALKANDSAAVAGMTRLPFMNDSSIRDAAQFRAKIYSRLHGENSRVHPAQQGHLRSRRRKQRQLLHLLRRGHFRLHQDACGISFD
jgi:hypothetical protein